jgi:uncharacterized protein (TIGR02217 family)
MTIAIGFHDVRFPTDISYGSEGGPEFSTEVVELSGGTERRNINWTYPRERWNVAYGVKTKAQLQELIAFFYARRGKAFAFRFKNHDDYSAGWTTLTESEDVPGTFQLVKVYGDQTYYLTRKITKPVEGTVSVVVDGTPVDSQNWDMDYGTGILTFASGYDPSPGAVVQATFQFDVPMRFDTDYLPVNFAEYEARSASVPLVEVKL